MTTERDDITSRFLALVESNPTEAYWLFNSLVSAVRDAEYPRLTVGTDEDGERVLIDPYNGEKTIVISEDIAFRQTFDEAPDFDGQTVSFWYDGGDFDGLVYRSDASDNPVRLPEGWGEAS